MRFYCWLLEQRMLKQSSAQRRDRIERILGCFVPVGSFPEQLRIRSSFPNQIIHIEGIFLRNSLISESNLILFHSSVFVNKAGVEGLVGVSPHFIWIVLPHSERWNRAILLGLGPVEDILVLFRVG